ncbi:transcriptional regulator, TetR family [Jatrophihabitans endophyticus]|uniref:Transcriptional regulator, TetR family n=1 Tax=Jatrophihabitans endophyticus TaxID=1206085 RepID=A0A1M5HPT6_9ACTN|nr:TetR/AcrR family transcriptional regulator [Jatrophihabitans endophyticus]SHG17898.1 transcriptional regulator, TetR family [Jatrophihabitans endophyticus]
MTRTAPAGAATTASRRTARERLLAAATELFYAEGIHTVGIDRIIERAGVAKASLYNTYGSKDELVRAYLQQRHELTSTRVAAVLERWDDPRDKLLGVFVAQGERMAEPDYHGCPFIGATAESPAGSPARQAADGYRGWLRGLFAELAAELGVADADTLSRQLVMLYDGAALAHRLDGHQGAAAAARAAAANLLDAALPR